jgi:hypothetical protein
MPTVIGVLFLIASLYCFTQNDDKLFGLVIFSAIFQSSSVIELRAAGVEPYYLVGSLFVLQGIFTGRSGINLSNSFKGKWWMILFAGIAILSAFTLPFVFAGIPVYEQHVGIDDGFFIRPPLQFTNANLTHSLSLLLGVLIVLGAAERARRGAFSRNSYRFTFYFLAGMVIVQFLCSALRIDFPYLLLQNHAGRSMQIVDTGDMGSRFPGTFTESAAAGQVLAGFTVGFLAEYLKVGRSLIRGLTGLAVMLLVRSSGAIAALAVALLFLLFSQPIFRFSYHVKVASARRVGVLIAIGVVIVGAVVLSPLRDSLIDMTLNKKDTDSYLSRLTSDLYALNVFVMTKGIGVGMGSNRPSSLITSLLSTVGLLGLVVFLKAYFKLLSNAGPPHSWLRWAGLAYFLSMVTSGPDYEAPWIWVLLAYIVHTGCSNQSESELHRLSTTPTRGLLLDSKSPHRTPE